MATFVLQQTAMELQVIIWVSLNSLVLGIPSGWYEFESAEYFFSSETLSWTEAKGACEGLGGALYVPSDNDTEWVASSILSYASAIFADSFVRTTLGTNATSWWVGVNDLAEELVFRDTNDNLVTYTDWFPGFPYNSQPTQNETDQDCVELLREFNEPVFLSLTKLTDVGRYYWNDTPCSDKQNYICKVINATVPITIATTTAETTIVSNAVAMTDEPITHGPLNGGPLISLAYPPQTRIQPSRSVVFNKEAVQASISVNTIICRPVECISFKLVTPAHRAGEEQLFKGGRQQNTSDQHHGQLAINDY
ncbi:hypothetical protein CAPTEDRAFT_199680 [Capitella teleta]|uniref:C-type lectin domain-containing protein n=1 Tax=Capitella teleta TaxID=283909 RepID=R7V786_CAPTE|nr:hypothetical protein CAPTEDRAFT_199680 [Capitella teleta]|eukprot:ELU14439.1 hypothetical protein CAPTEDRAFT_199680 [Capitella teleta]